MDADDVKDLVPEIAARSGHSLDKTESNPFCGNIHTVSDLVRFINARPHVAAVRVDAGPEPNGSERKR
jgi:hypothetical protein